MKYSIKQLRAEFPTEDACLEYIYKHKFGAPKGYTRIKGRKAWSHQSTKHQIHPLAGTIFAKSSTPLMDWFHVIFLFSSSKNGVSAKEIQRQLGCTYKTAWRMAFQIRKLMEQGNDPLSGIVEVDETYFGPKGKKQDGQYFKNKSALMGMVERQGKVRAKKIPHRGSEIVLPMILKNVAQGTHIMSDEYAAYKKLNRIGYTNSAVKHAKKQYVKGTTHTNTIEGFWGQLKRSIRGTYHFVSAKHLQSYVDEFTYRYNYRNSPIPIFVHLLSQASQ